MGTTRYRGYRRRYRCGAILDLRTRSSFSFWPFMGIKQALTFRRYHGAGLRTLALLFASSLIIISALAVAEEQVSPTQPPAQNEGFLAAFSPRFSQATAKRVSSPTHARKRAKI